MRERLSRSISFRLLLIFLALAAAFVYFSIVAVRWVYDTDELRELISGHLTLHIDYVLQDIGEPPNIARAQAITQKVPVDIRIAGPLINWASDSRFPNAEELNFDADERMSGAGIAWLRQLPDADFAELDGHRFLRISRGDHAIIVASPKIGGVVVARPLTPIIAGVGLSLVLLAYLAVRWLFRPISDIRRGAARIGQGRFSERITDVRQDQLGDLAADINKMAADVQGMLDAKRQLLLGISHELRTPLSRLRLAIELLDENERAALNAAGMRGDVNEMEKIITTLLEAEHLNSRHASLHVEECDPRELITALLDDYFARDRERLRVEFRGPQRLVQIDPARVLLLIKNLVSNALRYSNADSEPVRLVLEMGTAEFMIRVEDHGPGIPEEQRGKIGEPFFRGDPSRTRTTGGSGLGLYLATLVARAHGGELWLDPDYRVGAAFEVRIPA